MSKKIALGLVVAAALLAATAVYAEQWYEGGTLHKATAKEWHGCGSFGTAGSPCVFNKIGRVGLAKTGLFR